MDHLMVERGKRILFDFAQQNTLGKPDQVLSAAENPDGWLGVGLVWRDQDKRTAIRLGKEYSEEAAEIKRWAKEWGLT